MQYNIVFMKKYLQNLFAICMVLVLASVTVFAQSNVGIGITTPTEKLQVDSGSIKVGSTVWSPSIDHHWIKFGDGNFVEIGEDSLDDKMFFRAQNFVFLPSLSSSYSGNVGIGESSPTASLDVKGTIKYRDGSEGADKVLTSDILGNATWQTPTSYPGVAMKVCIALGGVFPSFGGGSGPSLETYLGEIKVFPYSQVPNGWAECNGQLLSITQNTALYALLGTTYGGDGITTFALPNLTGKVIIGN